MPERPRKHVEVEPLAFHRVAAIGRWRKGCRAAAVDGGPVPAHPLSYLAKGPKCPLVKFAPTRRAHVEQQVAVLGDPVHEHAHQQLRRLPVEVVPVVTPAAVESLASLPNTCAALHL